MAKTYSGREIVRILCREFGFIIITTKGSHIKLRRKMGSRTITTIVPLHRELAHGTLLGVLRLGEINPKDFQQAAS